MTAPNCLPQSDYIVGMWSLNEASGNVVDRVSGYTLTAVNTPSRVSAKIGNGVDFAKTSSQYFYVSQANAPNLAFTGEFTIAFWWKPETSTGGGTYRLVGKSHGGTTNKRAYLIFQGTDDSLGMTVSWDGTNYVQLSTMGDMGAMSSGTWYHLVGQLDQVNDKLYCYRNNVKSTSQPAYTNNVYGNNGEPFSIGAGQSAGVWGGYADGIMDEVIIWTKCLTADEIHTVYDLTSYTHSVTMEGVLGMAGQAYKKVPRTMEGSLSFSGDLSKRRIVYRTMEGFLGFSGGVTGQKVSIVRRILPKLWIPTLIKIRDKK